MIRLHNMASTISPLDAHALLTAIAWLRPCAAFGQILTIAALAGWLQVTLPLLSLAVEIAVLVLAAEMTFWRLRRVWPVGDVEAVCHVTFDMLLLG